jgi:hypothetical protein
MDTLGRLARKNGWIARRLADLVTSGWEAYRGLTVFIIRKRAVDLGYHDAIVEQIRSAGFHIVKAKTLPAECVREVSRHARGGNWSTGPWPTSGGPPAVAVAAFDSAPIEPTPAQCEKHPGLENARVLVKAEIRDRMNERLLPSDRCNVIHSSDNAWGAREYVQLAFAEEAADVLAAVTRLRGSHQAPAHGCELRRQP